VWWYYIDKNDVIQFTSCFDKQMKAHMLKVNTTITKNLIFAKNQMPLTVAQMAYVEVVLGVILMVQKFR
jgi:hypothetical protein